MKKINVGLIGYGLSGSTFHAPLLKALKQFEIHSVMSTKKAKVHADLGEVNIVEHLEDVIKNDDIELVIITTPNSLHYEMVKQSLLHKKHVIVEKPMVTSTTDGAELIEIAEQNNVMLSVYHNRRFDNDYLTVLSLIEAGRLGEVHTYKAHFHRYRPHVKDRWKERADEGGGSLYDLGAHLIDQALHLFGLPHFVIGDVTSQRIKSQADDYFHIIMGYERLRVILESGSIVKEAGPKYEIHGSIASFFKYGSDQQELHLKEGKSPLASDWGQDSEENYGVLTSDNEGVDLRETIETIPGSYLSYYEKIYEHIRHGAPSPVTAKEGLQTIELIEAVLTSSRENRTVFLSEQ